MAVFTPSISKLINKIKKCKKCSHLKNPKPIFSPIKNSKVLIIGQAPGKKEKELGLPFVGPAGKKLFSWFQKIGFTEKNIRKNLYITQVIKCYLESNRLPKAIELKNCLPYLYSEIELLKPKIIIPIGILAIKTILGKKKIDEVIGKVFKWKNSLIIPLPHPSGANVWLNKKENQRKIKKALKEIKNYFKATNITLKESFFAGKKVRC
ncbi:MAG: uracil-DNA glycosylase family protein [candidate division WOR-3 bacterium]|nr:uracil-DNA glycosylase family protein [candidate division WOR-3 bacterium]MCX7836591.1 uracil-DNA glycosylase family protein [candidate division WOR-3 bacterium]MDW8114157.1 uracil-DNA glycosylase family protein [candidate division WOR-3 bacterium]